MIPINAPPWQKVMYSYLGDREIPGVQTAPFISKFLAKLHAAWKDDETAWCGTFIAGSLEECNERFGTNLRWPKAWYRALAWSTYGLRLPPVSYRPGAICSKSRKGGGHVFCYIGENRTHIFGIGGNTNDMVREAWYSKSEIVAVVWPEGAPPLEAGDHRNWLNGGPVTPSANKES